MAYPEQRSLATKYYNTSLTDVSADSSAWVPISGQGVVIDASGVIDTALTVADAVVTVKKGSDTIGTITFTQSGSAAGSVFHLVVTGTEAVRSVKRGDVIEFDSDGGSTTTSKADFTLVVRET